MQFACSNSRLLWKYQHVGSCMGGRRDKHIYFGKFDKQSDVCSQQIQTYIILPEYCFVPKLEPPPPIPLWRDKQPSLSNIDYRERGDIDFRCTIFLFLRYISQSTENNKDQMLLTQHLAFTVSGAQQTIGTHVAVDDVNIRRQIMQMTN